MTKTDGQKLLQEFCGQANQPVVDDFMDCVEKGKDKDAIKILKDYGFSKNDAVKMIVQYRQDREESLQKYPELVDWSEIYSMFCQAEWERGIKDARDLIDHLTDKDAPQPMAQHKKTFLYRKSEVELWMKKLVDSSLLTQRAK